MNESCHTYESVMSHVRMSHVTYINGSCHTHQCPSKKKIRLLTFLSARARTLSFFFLPFFVCLFLCLLCLSVSLSLSPAYTFPSARTCSLSHTYTSHTHTTLFLLLSRFRLSFSFSFSFTRPLSPSVSGCFLPSQFLFVSLPLSHTHILTHLHTHSLLPSHRLLLSLSLPLTYTQIFLFCVPRHTTHHSHS